MIDLWETIRQQILAGDAGAIVAMAEARPGPDHGMLLPASVVRALLTRWEPVQTPDDFELVGFIVGGLEPDQALRLRDRLDVDPVLAARVEMLRAEVHQAQMEWPDEEPEIEFLPDDEAVSPDDLIELPMVRR